MWIWNDYLLPYLILGTRSKTLPVAIQIAMQGAYGATDWGGVMAMLVMAILPIIIFYLIAQRHIISVKSAIIRIQPTSPSSSPATEKMKSVCCAGMDSDCVSAPLKRP